MEMLEFVSLVIMSYILAASCISEYHITFLLDIDMEFKLIPKNNKMSVSWVLLIAEPTQGLIIQCADYTSSFPPPSPPLPLPYSPLFKHFITVLHLGQKNAKGIQKREESAQPFLL